MSSNNNIPSIALNKNTVSSTNATNGRLSSFGVPRDLTLGGLSSLRGARGGANKKVYAPNLNVTRNKNTNVKTSKDTTRSNIKRNDNQKSNRGARSKKDSNLLQTSSIFSEGIAVSAIKRNSESHSRRTDDVPLSKPTVSRSNNKIDLKAESINLKALLGESDEDYGPEESFDKIDIKYKPVKFNKESDILARNIEDVDLSDTSSRQIEKEFFESNDKKICLVQFPDVLPCESGDNNKVIVDKTNESKTNEMKGENIIDNLEEGQIGRLVRYKSGKCKLILGKTNYNVNIGLETGFLQELTSISTNTKERSGNIINLGLINSKMIVSPDWDFLLSQNL